MKIALCQRFLVKKVKLLHSKIKRGKKISVKEGKKE